MNNAFDKRSPDGEVPKQRSPGQPESEQRAQGEPDRPYVGRTDQEQRGRSDYEANYQPSTTGSSGPKTDDVSAAAAAHQRGPTPADDPLQRRQQQDAKTNTGVDETDGSRKAVSRKQTPQRH